MNKERLLKLADLLHDHSRGRVVRIPGDGTPEFSLNEWIGHRDCGTAACAVGCAMLSPEFQKMGLKTFDGMPKYRSAINWDAVERFFRLNGAEATHLFSSESYLGQGGDPFPKQVAKRIRKFVAEHGA